MIVAYVALHYGSPYLDASIRSYIDYVDKLYVLYSPNGSHGTRASAPLPPGEDEQTLFNIAHEAANGKLEWVRGDWIHEGEQRDTIYKLAPDAQAILVTDSDEIWGTGAASDAIMLALRGNASVWRVPMVHYWRSFKHCILHDPALPVRVLVPNRPAKEGVIEGIAPLNHMGYAIPDELMGYKWHIHGHRAELRKDIDWFRERWYNPLATTDLHPVGSDAWNYETIDPLDYLPAYMKDHKYWGLERIE